MGQKIVDIRALAPDAIILDFMIGQEPIGWQLLQLLKKQRDLRAIPCLVCTAAAATVDERGLHLRTIGVEAILKPFDIEHLLAALERVLQSAARADRPGTTVNGEREPTQKRNADEEATASLRSPLSPARPFAATVQRVPSSVRPNDEDARKMGSDQRMSRANQGNAGRAYASWALLGLSAVLFVVVAVLWYRDNHEKPKIAPPPTSAPGMNTAIQVKVALEAQGLKVTFSPGGGRSEDLSVAGQLLDVNGEQFYIFIYPEGPSQLQDDTVDLDLSEIAVVNTRGTPVAAGTPQVFGGSNVIGVLYGSSSEIAGKVRAAIEGLP